jgi:uncharacterized protein YjdB
MRHIRSAASVSFLLAIAIFSVSCGSSSSGPSLTSIDIAPISPTITVGDNQQFTATGHFSDGTTSNITPQSNWSSDNNAVATVENVGTQPGLATGKAVGKANITVSFAQGSSSVTATTDLTVEK